MDIGKQCGSPYWIFFAALEDFIMGSADSQCRPEAVCIGKHAGAEGVTLGPCWERITRLIWVQSGAVRRLWGQAGGRRRVAVISHLGDTEAEVTER